MKGKLKHHDKMILAFLIITGCYLYLLSATWFRWAHPIVDTFREFWIPLQILKGKTLYKEIFYEYGFFPPYFVAFMFGMVGVHLITLVSCGIGITLLFILILYKLARFFIDEFTSSLVVITFLFVFAFGNPNEMNFILPYSFASIFFLLFVSLALYFFLKFIFYEKEIYLLLWSLFLVLAFFSRIEMTFLIWVGFVSIGVLFMMRRKNQQKIKWVIFLCAPLIISLLGYSSFLYKTQAWDGFKTCIVEYILIHKNYPFNKVMLGIYNFRSNIFILALSFGVQASIVLLIGIQCKRISSLFQSKKKLHLELILRIFLLFLIFFIAKTKLNADFQFRCMTLILIIGLILFLIDIYRSHNFKRSIALFTIFLISLLMITRVLFAVVPQDYGFYLASLGLVCYYFFFFQIMPKASYFLFPSYKNAFYSPTFNFLLVSFFLYLILTHWCISLNKYKLINYQVETNIGKLFFSNSQQTSRYWQTIAYLRKNTPKDGTLVVLPEGIGMNLFSNRENPTGYCNFTPPILELLNEEKIINRFKQTNIDYILIVSRKTPEYGLPHFGTHYGEKINLWIKGHYKIEKLIGPYPFTRPGFGAALYKKKIEKMIN